MFSCNKVNRRHVMGRVLSITALFFCAPFWSTCERLFPSVGTTRAVNEVLSQFYETVVARFDGEALRNWIASDRYLQSIVADKGVRRIIGEILGGNLSDTPVLSSRQLRQRIEQSIRADFASEDVLLVEGWMIARTEALLIWLTKQ
jgi:hypothetical protein